MSRKARANGRRRRGKRAASAALATAGRATPVAAVGTRTVSRPSSNGASGTAGAASRPRQTATSVGVAEVSRQAERGGPARTSQLTARSTSPDRMPTAVAVAVAPASNGAHGGAVQRENEQRPARQRWLSILIGVSRAGDRTDLARQARIARSIVARYLRSGWFIAEVVGVAVLFALCFGASFDGAYFYRVAGLALCLFAVIATYALDHAVASPHLYVRRSLRMLGRPTVAPLVFAATITRFVSFVLLLALVFVVRRLAPVEPLALMAGAVGLLANCALIVAVTVACSTPFARRGTQLGVLAWLVCGLATYSPGTIFSSTPIVSWLLRLPLLPFATCYNFGVTGGIGWSGVAALVAETGMIAVAVALTNSRLRRRLSERKRSDPARQR